MPRPERQQLAFDFVQEVKFTELPRPEPYPMPAGHLAGLYNRESGVSRFVHTVAERITIKSPAQAAHHLCERIYSPFASFEQEELWVLLFNHRNRLTHEVMIYRGTINTVVVRPAEIFREAVRVNASALLLSHIHPSGDPQPSPEDIHTTEQLIQASKVLDIPLLDHIIVGDGAWVSLQEQGLAFGTSSASDRLASAKG